MYTPGLRVAQPEVLLEVLGEKTLISIKNGNQYSRVQQGAAQYVITDQPGACMGSQAWANRGQSSMGKS